MSLTLDRRDDADRRGYRLHRMGTHISHRPVLCHALVNVTRRELDDYSGHASALTINLVGSDVFGCPLLSSTSLECGPMPSTVDTSFTNEIDKIDPDVQWTFEVCWGQSTWIRSGQRFVSVRRALNEMTKFQLTNLFEGTVIGVRLCKLPAAANDGLWR